MNDRGANTYQSQTHVGIIVQRRRLTHRRRRSQIPSSLEGEKSRFYRVYVIEDVAGGREFQEITSRWQRTIAYGSYSVDKPVNAKTMYKSRNANSILSWCIPCEARLGWLSRDWTG